MRRLLFVGLPFVAACQLTRLVEPLPHYVWACAEYRTVTVTMDGHASSARTCVREDWVPRVDTLAPMEAR